MKILIFVCLFAFFGMGKIIAGMHTVGPKIVNFGGDISSESDELKLIEERDIPCGDAGSLRLFFLISSAIDQNDKISENEKVKLSIYHNHAGGSTLYEERDYISKGGSIKGFVELPIYGESIRVIIWNSTLKRGAYSVVVTCKSVK